MVSGLAGMVDVVDVVVGVDVAGFDDAGVRAEFVAVRREIDRLEAHAARLLAVAHRRLIPVGEGAASTPSWARQVSGQRPGDAKASLDAGLAGERLPLTVKAWVQGELSASAARTITRGMRAGHEDVYGEVEESLVAFGVAGDFRRLDAVIRHYQACADALDDVEPADKNHLHLSQAGNRWAISGDLDDVAGHTLAAALEAATDRPVEGDSRSVAKRRADALTRIGRFFLDHGDAAVSAGAVPHVSVVIDWDTIGTGVPGEADLDGPSFTPAALGRLLCDCEISRVVVGSSSRLLDIGRAQRSTPTWMRRAIVARDRGCRFPGCDRAARHCEAHHVWAWDDGGPTAVDNLVLLCPFHHHLIHRRRWRTTFDGDAFTVTDPNDRLIGTTRAPPRRSRTA